MNPTPKIPRGWKKIRPGWIIRRGDKYNLGDKWVSFIYFIGDPAVIAEGETYIRRVKGRK